ncbi:S46 family peptidase [Marilutibacter chinensis]|uniref:Dipeptidyl-peptidase n=1 Tax=Marilutibacter chinensis TaxID=2912247 RepID=A0ABS9HSX8_9GAMM|nr:S46 family peptidase [Lysobacter chinensis]MCF7221270.1 S46 family peptidase [Lysobacter chinensis]MCF7222989.1 S46 family peptidase [Lysobacter chinensis]
MWVPQQLPEIAKPLRKAGLKLDPEQLADLTGDPMGAVVSLGGCTASFVSPQGLVVTNHHCAYGAIQLNSTPESNLMQDGFNAATRGEEVSAGPNARIYALDSIRDVTAQVKTAIEAAPDALGRTRALETVEKQLVADCEAEDGYRCRLYSFAGGNTYRLFRNLEIRDVRLVYAPPGSVGNYGGEVDNWMWPRHTGDFSFYRAYVGKDGKPAAYAEDNVPYQPKHWLKIADRPLEAGDFVMVAGYPGRTARYALAEEFDETANWTYPTVGRHYRNLVALVEAAGKQDPEIAVKYASTVRGWQNAMKNYDGQLEGFRRIDATATKHAEETAVLEWLRGRGEAGRAALEAHARLVELDEQARAHRERDLVFGQLRHTGAIGAAVQLYRLSIERAKPDAEREPGYQERDLPAFEGGLQQMERRYDPKMDRELQAYWLREYLKLPQTQRVAVVDEWLGGNDQAAIDKALDTLARTDLGVTEIRLNLMKSDRAAFEKSRDPAIRFAVAIMPTLLALEEEGKARAGDALLARPLYLQAVADYRKSKGGFVYPDANSSLRITFGNVMSYTKADGSVQAPFTRLEEVAAKATGEAPFDAPQALLDAVAAKNYGGLTDRELGTVPVNFMADLDITGGNSGSPAMDAHGRLVGLVFDMNWESVSSNWVFDPAMTRVIGVDQRYMRWIMQEVFPAPQVLAELGVPEKD